jgi:hypothetical protein
MEPCHDRNIYFINILLFLILYYYLHPFIFSGCYKFQSPSCFVYTVFFIFSIFIYSKISFMSLHLHNVYSFFLKDFVSFMCQNVVIAFSSLLFDLLYFTIRFCIFLCSYLWIICGLPFVFFDSLKCIHFTLLHQLVHYFLVCLPSEIPSMYCRVTMLSCMITSLSTGELSWCQMILQSNMAGAILES